MAESMILGFTHTDGSDAANAAVLTQYTDTSGFCRAQVDQFDKTLIYLEPSDPLPAVQTAMAAVVTQYVQDNYTLTATMNNPHERVQAIIQNTRVSLANWLNANARDDIAAFLNVEASIRATIVKELVAQGILA